MVMCLAHGKPSVLVVGGGEEKMRKEYATVKKKHQLSIIIEIMVVSPCAIVIV